MKEGILGQEKTVILEGGRPGTGTDRGREIDADPKRIPARRVFLLSPANAAGMRAQRLLREDCQTELAVRLRGAGIGLGELFSFMSSLYFRGKLAYAKRFAAPPESCHGVLVITPSRGLLAPEALIMSRDLEEMAAARVDLEDERYLKPLERDARLLLQRLGEQAEVVLLGSVATSKYVEPLARIFGCRLMFPAEFTGRGDMSRGGLLLRCVREGTELDYLPVGASVLSAFRAKKGKKKAGG